MQIRRIAAHYEEIAGHSLIHAINEECHGDTRRAYKVQLKLGKTYLTLFVRLGRCPYGN